MIPPFPHKNDDHAVYIELKETKTDNRRSQSFNNMDYYRNIDKSDSSDTSEIENSNQQAVQPKETKDLAVRYFVFICCIFFLIIGRYNVPNNEPLCIVDKIMDLLGGINAYILANPSVRDTMQIVNSAFMDIMFIATFLNWVHHGTSTRLIIVTGMFYLIRATVQAIWYSPYPDGFWWYDPGIPSLVVPYGKGSDFFFSGHIGFAVICRKEWQANKKPFMVNFITVGAIYTMFVLIVFRIHYSIDIFAGVIVAHWCFLVIDMNKEKIDSIFSEVYDNVKDGVMKYQNRPASRSSELSIIVSKSLSPKRKEMMRLNSKEKIYAV